MEKVNEIIKVIERRRRKMEKLNDIIKVIEKITNFEDLQAIGFDGDVYHFIGFNQGDEKVKIKVTVFNDTFVIYKEHYMKK